MPWAGMKDNVVYHTLTEQELNDVTSKMQMAHGHATQLSGTSLGVDDTNPDLHRSVEAGDSTQLAVFGKNSYRIQEVETSYDQEGNPDEIP